MGKINKTIDKMNYDELQQKKDMLLFQRFIGIILLIALLLGFLILVMIKDINVLDSDFYEDYVSWVLSAYGLVALGALGIIQIFLSTVDYHRVLSNLKSRMDKDAGGSY